MFSHKEPPYLDKHDLRDILYSNRFQPNDQVKPLIEDLLKALDLQDDNDFRIRADYPYDSNGNLITINS